MKTAAWVFVALATSACMPLREPRYADLQYQTGGTMDRGVKIEVYLFATPPYIEKSVGGKTLNRRNLDQAEILSLESLVDNIWQRGVGSGLCKALPDSGTTISVNMPVEIRTYSTLTPCLNADANRLTQRLYELTANRR